MKVVSFRKLLVCKVRNDQQRERDSARAREREGWRVREIERENANFNCFSIVCFLCPSHATGN